MNPCLRFEQNEVLSTAGRYKNDIEIELMELKPKITARGFMKKVELQKIACWKSPRGKRHVLKNSEEYVKEITEFAFATTNERARVESLTLLDGVSWPTASAILHLFHRNLYPILDFRALWSVCLEVPSQYVFDFWWPYVEFCRDLAQVTGVDMRTLDRALWQYSKENS